MTTTFIHPLMHAQRTESGLYEVYNYLNNATDYDQTISKLALMGVRAQVSLAEVHLQQAADVPTNAAVLLKTADETLRSRVENFSAGFDPKAVIRLSQIPLLKAGLVYNELPSPNLIKRSFRQTLLAATTAANHFSNARNELDSNGYAAAVGCLNESSVLLLLQRYALRHDITSSWLPLSTTIRDAVGGQTKGTAKPRRGWNISIFQPGDNTDLSVAHKLQIKSRSQACDYEKDITVVHVDPGLKMAGDQSLVASRIIYDMAHEAEYPKNTKAAKRLNYRTELLLDMLG